MSAPTILERPEKLRSETAEAVRPPEVYAAFRDWCDEAGHAAPRAAYLFAGGDRYERDPAYTTSVESPTQLTNDSHDLDGVLIEYEFRGRPLGAFLIDSGDPAQIEALRSTFEQECAAALFRASYLQETIGNNARMKEQLYYLDEMGKLLGRLDLDMLLVNILELTSDHLGADIGSITLLGTDGELETAVDWGLPHEAITSLTLNDGKKALDSVLESREPLLLTEADLVADDQSPYHFERLLLLPLCTKDAAWGSINLIAPADVLSVDSEQIASTRSGVALAATAVENALLFEIKLAREREQEQLRVAQQIQSSLLPSEAPAATDIDVSGSSVPATMIGGDYFDYFELPDGLTGLVVADVAGKGVPAGLIMTATRALFRAAAKRHSEPGALLEEVNVLLCAEDFGSRFVTAVFATIDSQAHCMRFACAGHDSPLVLRKSDGSVEDWPQPALPLGLRPHAEYQTVSVEFHAGDAAVLFTDGVSEAMDEERVQFGIDRLREVMTQGRGEDSQALLKRVVDSVGRHCGAAPRHDDTTLIVVRRT